ncbi:MAG: hypothetical protein IJO76_07915 [Clostridia bacterium]|nr:hypothetical protein [Clostridia bacterium]
MSGIVGIGACVMDTLYTVPFYPTEDTKLRALDSRPAGGGPVATGLVAAAKLGERAGYIGVLSDDAGGKFLLEDFARYGVDTQLVGVNSGYRSFTSVIWLCADSASRTIVFDKGDLPPLSLSEAQRQAICDASVLMVDGNELDAAVEAAKLAQEHGTAVLYDAGGLYPGIEKLLPHVDYLIPSCEYALGHTGCVTVEAAAQTLYQKYHPRVVVITCGAEGGVYYDGERAVRYPCYPVDVVDSNGSGDVFHGAFAAGLEKGFSPLQCCHFASAVSALKCTGIGARNSVPDYDSVIAFLKENGYEL